MTPNAIEITAELVYQRVGLPHDVPTDPLHLGALLFDGRVHRVPALATEALVADSELLVRSSLTRAGASWFGAVAISRWLLNTDGPDAEMLAACLRAPRRAVGRAIRARGAVFSDLAAAFRSSESFAALRFAEVSHTPLALIVPNRPTRLRADRRPLAWCRVRLSDAPDRLVLMGA